MNYSEKSMQNLWVQNTIEPKENICKFGADGKKNCICVIRFRYFDL